MPQRRNSSASSIVMRPPDNIFEPTIPHALTLETDRYPSTLPLLRLHPFPNHPFQVRQDEELYKLTESIKEHGVAEPILCRPGRDGEGYEVISGHRRVEACKMAGLSEAPVIVREMDDDLAVLVMVDANLHREKILPSEKAYSYKMKVEALNRRRSAQAGLVVSEEAPANRRATEVVGEEAGENYRNVMRYIRLTFLERPLLDMVDDGKIKLHPAVELSYLKLTEQAMMRGIIQDSKLVPSLQQAKQFKSISQVRNLTITDIEDILLAGRETTLNISFKLSELQRFFPSSYSPAEIKDGVIETLENRQRNRGMER